MYHIEVSPAANRDLDKLKAKILKKDIARISEAVNALLENPRPDGSRKIKGTDSVYCMRVGNFRIVYEIHDATLLILLLRIVRRSKTTYKEY